ncbi:MAG: hypothetical protein ACRCSN_09880 [Dermatophilaceae bacterium]
MSAAAACIILGVLVAVLIKTKVIKLWGGLLCVVFGITVAASPVGPAVGDVLADVGGWAYAQLRAV